MKNLAYPTLLLTLLLLIGSCASQDSSSSQSADSAKHSADVPELLDRSEKIRLDKEWDFVQNQYGDLKSKISSQDEAITERIELAQLFVREARVTGEHGHYYPAALALCDDALAIESSSKDQKFNALVTKAGVQLSLHEFEDALKTAEEALTYNQINAQVHGVLVDCYVELGEYEKAVETADRMIAIKPDIRSYSRISYLREIHGDIEGAEEALTLAVKSGYPGYEETAWAMLTLGELYAQYGEKDKARRVYEEILMMRKDYPFAIAALAQLDFDAGDVEQAEKRLNEAAAIIPEVGYYTQLAEIYKSQDRSAEFEKVMPEIFEMLEDDVAAGHNMNLEYADIYLNLYGDTDKALAYAKKEEAKRPKNIDVNRLLAEIYTVRQEKELASRHFELASSTQSAHPTLKELEKYAAG